MAESLTELPPVLRVRGLTREFPAGDSTIQVLKGIDLDIHRGELVALIGQSGSGKSTLMNILGCLDRPSQGMYEVSGKNTADLSPDELAQLRREHFGFIFQRYHLLSDLSAQNNVEVPAIYAGRPSAERSAKARALLTELGLGQKLANRPGQLSGGQQQRVSIARALMNGGDIIFADEPTGALDSQSGAEVLNILNRLHREGHTVILITHDPSLAQQAERIIELKDGIIVRDERKSPLRPPVAARTRPAPSPALGALWARFREAFGMALLSMASHRMRTFLTMLGIIIGIASVVSVVALGNGSQQKILSNISQLGTNTITLYPGKDFGDMRSGAVQTLRADDAEALRQQPYVDSVSPQVNSSTTLRHGNIEAAATLNGVGESYFQVRGLQMARGQWFEHSDVRSLSQGVIIDDNTLRKLFEPGTNPLGQIILLGKLPARVVGVLQPADSMFGNSNTLNVYLPYTTVMSKITGTTTLRNITVRIRDDSDSAAAEAAMVQLITDRHGSQDVFTQNSDSIRQTIESTTTTMTLLVSSIAVISLLVGGIGVMNIMLVSVTERTQEIGVRMAVGARQSDILQQFLIEAMLVCLLGGLLGVGLALLIGQVFGQLADSGNLAMRYSTGSMLAAFACSTLIGVLFGFLPARSAARLDPVVALARD